MTKQMPKNTTMAVAMSRRSRGSLNTRGSMNVTNKGKVEKVTKPTATLEIWIDRKKKYQCTASKPPCKMNRPVAWPGTAESFVPEISRAYRLRVMAANSVLPRTIYKGLALINLANSPDKPNNSTALWITNKGWAAGPGSFMGVNQASIGSVGGI